MEINSIGIENFKGIKATKINFAKCPNANVFTLVGPNECGKTTVLEAMHSIKSDMDNQAVLIGVDERKSPNDNVPISQRGSFTGNIKIEMDLAISAEELKDLQEGFLKNFGREMKIEGTIKNLVYEITDRFEAGDHKGSSETWSLAGFKVAEQVTESVMPPPSAPPVEGHPQPQPATTVSS
ncbi:MAG TPA: AAA family ATPase, partial [Micavibrio sp.]